VTDQQIERVIRLKYSTSRATHMRKRRARLLDAGVCINAASHGAPMEGYTKCAACVEAHRRSR
jgi:hypothetical protein